MTEEKTAAPAHEGRPVDFPGAVELAVAMMKSEPRIPEAFKTGEGVGRHAPDACLFRGTERFSRPGYMRHLPTEWIPSLHGVKDKLEAGANVADVGCGHGASTIPMAQDVGDRVTFEVARAKDFPRKDYALVAFFDRCMTWAIRRGHRVTFIRP